MSLVFDPERAKAAMRAIPPREPSPTLERRSRNARLSFNPYLGLVCAESWWDLGKLLAHRNEPAWIDKQLPGWRKEEHPDNQPYITREAVMDFADAIHDLLRRKFRNEPIAEQATEINRLASQTVYRENGQYLEGDESFEAFWAVEKRFVLDELGEPTEKNEESWLAAVSECHECHEFFVKQRRDQIFDKAKCRTTFTNRDAYLRRRKTRRH